jgi:tRNA(Arg) A34 adenosine deaminase TadA
MKAGNTVVAPELPDLYKQANSELADYWARSVGELTTVNLSAATPDVGSEAACERHRIYCLLLMKLIHRFWNGNKRGPLGEYPRRARQKLAPGRYRGDMFASPMVDTEGVMWDRYLGHNIACIAVDGHGRIIDFEFNHNDLFRSSAEHAEARMVRRLFGLANIPDHWQTGEPLPKKSRAFSLKDVTLYTSLESCAQCSGVMSLGRVKQVVYLQNDPGAYMIGDIMYNLAGKEDGDGSSLAAIPIPASAVGLSCRTKLNAAYSEFMKDMDDARQHKDVSRAFFLPPGDGSNPALTPDFSNSITSFLCTDAAFAIFESGAKEFDALDPRHPTAQYGTDPDAFTNKKALDEARSFFAYADVEGFRGSPHKL